MAHEALSEGHACCSARRYPGRWPATKLGAGDRAAGLVGAGAIHGTPVCRGVGPAGSHRDPRLAPTHAAGGPTSSCGSKRYAPCSRAAARIDSRHHDRRTATLAATLPARRADHGNAGAERRRSPNASGSRRHVTAGRFGRCPRRRSPTPHRCRSSGETPWRPRTRLQDRAELRSRRCRTARSTAS